jgi:hypothetical protein
MSPEDPYLWLRTAQAFLIPLRRSKPRGSGFSPGTKTFWLHGPTGKLAAMQAGKGPSVLLPQAADLTEAVVKFLSY